MLAREPENIQNVLVPEDVPLAGSCCEHLLLCMGHGAVEGHDLHALVHICSSGAAIPGTAFVCLPTIRTGRYKVMRQEVVLGP